MAGGKIFSTLDISQAYLNIEMDEESAKIQAISTEKGVYTVNRLMFGIKVAPAEWQRFISQTLEGIPGVAVFFDDIKVQGRNLDEHANRLRQVLSRLAEKNLKVNKTKCQFFKDKINYLGHIISQEGVQKDVSKALAVLKAPRPNNKDELRSWVGLVNYYARFVSNLATKLNPLYQLLKKDVKFIWSRQSEKSWIQVKAEISSDRVLMAYDENLPLLLATDASPVGIGAVLSHRLANGEERPIAYASRTLSKAESSYSQIEKEATAIYWGVVKFYQYLFGRKFSLITDHKPLVSILNPHKQLPPLTAQRLLRYAIFLQGFDYKIEYKNTKNNGNADALSRLPCERAPEPHIDEVADLCLHQISILPVTHAEIAAETQKDSVLRKVYDELLHGGGVSVPGFSDKEFEFSLQLGCIMRGDRVVIPQGLRMKILEELHSAHIGMVRMKALARSYVWWPNLDRDIEACVKECNACKFNQKVAAKAWHPWQIPENRWQRIHIDYLGPVRNLHMLVVVDAYSKWLEVVPVRRVTSFRTIEILREIFARFGLPLTLVSDNATVFTSDEFKNFLKSNSILHRTIPPHHPSSNGQAERCVQTVKMALKKMAEEPGDINFKLSKFLMAQHRAINTVTGQSPSDIMFGWKIRTKLDCIRPEVQEKYYENDNSENGKGKVRRFAVGERVIARNYSGREDKWKEGVIVRRSGRMMYWVRVDRCLWKRHADQLRSI